MSRIAYALLGVALLLAAFGVAKADPLTATITAPTTGECLAANSTYTIKWTTPDPTLTSAALAYRSDGQTVGTWTSNQSAYFVEGAPNSGSYSWTTPATATTTGRLTLETSNADHSLATDSSSNLFNIDATPPDQPVLTLAGPATTSATFTWKPVADTGCATLLGYKIYQNDLLVATVDKTVTTYTATELTSGTTYKFRVDAYDAVTSIASSPLLVTAGNDSATPSPVPSTSAATSPTFSTIIVQDVTDTSATITFTADQNIATSVDYGPTTQYGKNQTTTITPQKSNWAYSAKLTNLDPNTTYYFRLVTSTTKSIDASFTTKLSSGTPPIVTGIMISGQAISPNSTDIAKVVTKEVIKITGTAAPGTTVMLLLHSSLQTFRALTDGAGNWSATINTNGLLSGDHDITLGVLNGNGQIGPTTTILKFQLVSQTNAAPITFEVPDPTKASAYGKLYGDTFLTVTIVCTLWLIVISHLRSRKKRTDSFASVRYHSHG